MEPLEYPPTVEVGQQLVLRPAPRPEAMAGESPGFVLDLLLGLEHFLELEDSFGFEDILEVEQLFTLEGAPADSKDASLDFLQWHYEKPKEWSKGVSFLWARSEGFSGGPMS